MNTPALSYRARWLFPVDSPPLANGYLTVADGKIVAIGTDPQGKVVDLGDVALVPGFINAHTHLDLCGLSRSELASTSFCDWLKSVILHRRQSLDSSLPLVETALDSMMAAGTTGLGDITTSNVCVPLIQSAGLRARVFREIVGLRRRRYKPLWIWATEAFAQSPVPTEWSRNLVSNDPGVSFGVSPHSPYSTASVMFQSAGYLEPRTCLTTHWLESEEEVAFLRGANGPMADFLRELGALPDHWQPPTNYWDEFLGSGSGWVLAHANYLDETDKAILVDKCQTGRVAGIVYCPRTHAWFGHSPHPFRELLRHGVTVGLGTDSSASNPDLQVFGEAQFLAAKNPAVDPMDLLTMLTSAGAELLGWSRIIGTLTPGKQADCAILDIGQTDDFAALFAPTTIILETLIGGITRWLAHGWHHRNP